MMYYMTQLFQIHLLEILMDQIESVRKQQKKKTNYNEWLAKYVVFVLELYTITSTEKSIQTLSSLPVQL